MKKIKFIKISEGLKRHYKRNGHPMTGKTKENSTRLMKISTTLKQRYKEGTVKCGFKKGYTPVNKKYFDNRNAYIRIAFNNLKHLCNRCKNKDKRVLIVHHKDRNKKNNNLANLEIICANCHMIEHLKDKKVSYYKK
jgi:5-methylcytosine-specific restriction endonuclease McrA